MILTGSQIQQRMDDELANALVLLPRPQRGQIHPNEASVDVRLGHEFVVAQRPALDVIDPLALSKEELATSYLRRLYIPADEEFVLHPRQFALGVTLEYLRMPTDLCAQVAGRSRWARVGLIIAMAPFVHPGYSGCLTLELQNLGDVPIKLYPGLPIAQIMFQTCTHVSDISRAQRVCCIGPEPPELLSEEERRLVSGLRSAGS